MPELRCGFHIYLHVLLVARIQCLFPTMHLRMGVKKPHLYKLPLWLVNLADLVLILAPSFGSLGKHTSIQLGSDLICATSTSQRSIEGSARYSTGVELQRSSCEAVASFAKASTREFPTLGTCLT